MPVDAERVKASVCRSTAGDSTGCAAAGEAAHIARAKIQYVRRIIFPRQKKPKAALPSSLKAVHPNWFRMCHELGPRGSMRHTPQGAREHTFAELKVATLARRAFGADEAAPEDRVGAAAAE